MKKCKKCNVNLSDSVVKCPVCGSAAVWKEEGDDFVEAEYNIKKEKESSLIVRDIFWGITAVAAIITAIFSLVFLDFRPVFYTVYAASFIWLAVLNNVFRRHNTKKILDSTFIYIIFYSFVMFWYFNALNLWLIYFMPIASLLAICTYSMMIFIGRFFRKYCISLMFTSSLSLIVLLVNYVEDLSLLYSLISGCVAVIAIAASIVFGRKTLRIEFAKRFHI